MSDGERRDGVPADGTVVVVGASLAGLRAAQGLREGGFTGRLVLVGDERHLPYDRPPLSKQVLAGTWPPERTELVGAQTLADLEVEVRLGCRARSLDAEVLRVELDDGTELSAKGNVVDHEFEIERDGEKVAEISKRWFRVRDTYGVEVADGQDDPLILAVTVCIDEIANR